MAENNDFAALLAELEPLAKAMPKADCDDKKAGEGDAADDKAGDDKIAAAAADGAAEGDDGEEPFGKSFKVTLDDGTEVDAFDGTAMMKALHGQIEILQADRDGMFKALTAATEAVKFAREAIGEQGALIKSLQGEVAALRNTGSGRRSVVSVLEKPNTTVPAGKPDPLTPATYMAKALSLQGQGKLSAVDIARGEAHLNKFGQLPAELAPFFA